MLYNQKLIRFFDGLVLLIAVSVLKVLGSINSLYSRLIHGVKPNERFFCCFFFLLFGKRSELFTC